MEEPTDFSKVPRSYQWALVFLMDLFIHLFIFLFIYLFIYLFASVNKSLLATVNNNFL